jgi:hypothetical protein
MKHRKRYTVWVSAYPDEEDDMSEEGTTSPGIRPNAYWADVRAHQALEAAREEGYGADYRGVPMPKSGSQSVRASQTTGSYDLCWCGEPADHDWPGKDRGRKHPRTPAPTTRKAAPEMPSAPAEAPHIERKHLRTFHEGLVDVIVRAVNDYHVRYRLSNNGCILYPPDGTQPYTIYARNTERQVRASRKWFIDHVVGTEGAEALVKDQTRLVEDMDAREAARMLAEKLNSEEHEVPPETPKETSGEKRARKSRERREEAEKMAAAAVARKEAEAAVQPQPEEPGKTTPQIHVRENGDPADEGEWVPWRNRLGEINEHYETDGYIIKCRECDFTTTKGQGVSGHYLTNHSPDHRARMYGPQAQEKKAATKREQKIEHAITGAIELLLPVLGKDYLADTQQAENRIKELEDQLVQSRAEVTQALIDRDAAVAAQAEADRAKGEVEARLELMREALRV